MTQRNGFTLLEVLVALVVFSLMLAGLTQEIRHGVQAWDLQRRSVARTSDLDAVDGALRRMIEQMDPGTRSEPPFIQGDQTRIAFTTDLPQSAAGPLTQHANVVLLVEAGRLVLRWAPHRHVHYFGPPPKPMEIELLDRLKGIELAYWQPSGGWSASWHADRLPELVRIRIIFTQGVAHHWPDIIAAPMRERLEQ